MSPVPEVPLGQPLPTERESRALSRRRGSAGRRFNGFGHSPPRFLSRSASQHLIARTRNQPVAFSTIRLPTNPLPGNPSRLPAEIVYGSEIEIRFRAKRAPRRCVEGCSVRGETGS
jgi:hypothetical protein